MSTATQYWFQNNFFAGPFSGWNQPFPDGGFAWITGGGCGATLARVRPGNEQVTDIGAAINVPAVLSQVDGLLGSSVNRTSGLLAAGVFWPSVPYYSNNPGLHGQYDMLVRIYVNFHINTPWYCSDADGNISYYLFLALDGSGHLQGNVDGWSWHYDGGHPFCTGSIDNQLNASVPAGMPTVQSVLDVMLAAMSGSTFSTLYYLPGSGTSAPGSFSENADQDVAIALLP